MKALLQESITTGEHNYRRAINTTNAIIIKIATIRVYSARLVTLGLCVR